MFSCEQHCIVPQYCNFDRQIALSNLQLTGTKLQVKIHKRFVNKASDWTIRKREAKQENIRFDCNGLIYITLTESDAIFIIK
jgi:hypothetical protein